jgi:hypothetical protein
MSALKREGIDLQELLKQANASFTHQLQTLDLQKYIIPSPAEVPLTTIDAVQTGFQKLSFFEQIEDIMVDSSIEGKIANLKETQFTQKRRDDFFKKHKKEQ